MSLNPSIVRCVLLPLALAVVLLQQVYAAEQKLVAGGMEIYYGIVPAEIVARQAGKTDAPMHSGRVRKNFRHLVVTLYDAETGQRISDAAVDATVTPLALAPSSKRLEPMRIGDTITYGNFFDFPPDGAPFRVLLKIARPGRPTHSATFEYRL